MNAINLECLVNKMDAHAKSALESALNMVLNYNQSNVEIEHWLYQLITIKNDNFLQVLDDLAIPVVKLKKSLLKAIESHPVTHSSAPVLSQNQIDLMKAAWQMSSLEYNMQAYTAPLVLCALLNDALLNQYAIQCAPQLKTIDVSAFKCLLKSRTYMHAESPIEVQPRESLDQFTVDLVALAANGEIDPVVGREFEIRQMMDILLRRRQNNPILTGEPGVGKTAIVEGLALRIAQHTVPACLAKVKIHALDLGLLQAGAGVKGEFERRLKALIQEIEHSPVPIILFIDEAHTLVGAGATPGQGDAANLLKPALARGQLRVIAASTWSEYKKYFETDAALTRRFQLVNVKEPDEYTAMNMLRSQVDKLEQHHSVKVLSTAIEAAVTLSNRYLSERQLPDSAVSVLDTACARVADEQSALPVSITQLQERQCNYMLELKRVRLDEVSSVQRKKINKLNEKLIQVGKQLDEMTSNYNKEKLLINEINALEKDDKKDASQIKQLKKQLKDQQKKSYCIHRFVDQDMIAEVIANWTGIPKENMLRAPMQSILLLKEQLQLKIVGQNQALTMISNKLLSAKAKLSSNDHPTAVFLLVGPSGVGKTQTAYMLAETIFGGTSKMTTINMSEFKEAHKISTLTGSPPGYVGYGQGGVLTEAIRRDPYSLILLDEMEKAHPSVQELFFQVFDKGELHDSEGRDIDCRNSLLVMTSNAASEYIHAQMDRGTIDICADEFKAGLHKVLCESFSPAFIGRVTVVPYLPLMRHDLMLLARRELDLLSNRAQRHYNIQLIFDDSVSDFLVMQCQQDALGARQIYNSLSQDLLPYVSTQLIKLNSKRKNNACVRISYSHKEWVVA